jgi:hypothetical protein
MTDNTIDTATRESSGSGAEFIDAVDGTVPVPAPVFLTEDAVLGMIRRGESSEFGFDRDRPMGRRYEDRRRGGHATVRVTVAAGEVTFETDVDGSSSLELAYVAAVIREIRAAAEEGPVGEVTFETEKREQ